MQNLHNSTNLRWRTYRYCEGLLLDWQNYDKLINARTEELMNPHRIQDENIGGGRSPYISNTTERIASTLIEDERLMRLQAEKEAIKSALDKLNKEYKRVIDMAYFARPRTKTWEGIAMECGYSARQCYRIRDKVIEDIAEKLGMM